MIDETKLNTFIGKILGDLGGAATAPLVRMGESSASTQPSKSTVR